MNRAKDVAIVVLLSAVVYLLSTRDRTHTAPEAPPDPHDTIAVLPYVNATGNPEIEYLSDSLWAATIDSLAEHPHLRVASKTASSKHKASNADIRTIGEALDVSYFVEGSVRTNGNTVEITAQLVQAENGHHVWWETFQTTAETADPVAGEISDAVADALGNRISAQ